MTSARDRAIERIADALQHNAAVVADLGQTMLHARVAVDALAAWKYQDDQEGWLFSRGDVMVLLETDRDGDDDGNSYGTWVARSEEDSE